MQCIPVSEFAVVVEFGDRIDRTILDAVWSFARLLDQFPLRGVVEYVTAYATVTVFVDPSIVDVTVVAQELSLLSERVPSNRSSDAVRTIEVPVCYGGDFGPDLPLVAEQTGLSQDDVVALHSESEYLVYLIGFVPGFPYLGGMSPRLAIPRRPSPRPSVPAGSIGIAGEQTGIYPRVTPGGWQLIGRTPLVLFDPQADPPSLFQPGDRVRFRPILAGEFQDQLRAIHGSLEKPL